MSIERVGYARLIERFALPALPLSMISEIDTSIRARGRTHLGTHEAQRFPPAYLPEDTPRGDLQFALRYEGLNLEVLALMFAKRGSQDLEHWTGAASESVYGRRLAFLYEWLTGESLPFEVSSKASYVPVVDRTIQFGLTTGVRNSRFRVIDNLPGNRKFCPLVRRSVMTH